MRSVAEMQSMNNRKCRKHGLSKTDAECRKCLENSNCPFQFPCIAQTECGKRGVCNMEINK